jgi:hypothetical protein
MAWLTLPFSLRFWIWLLLIIGGAAGYAAGYGVGKYGETECPIFTFKRIPAATLPLPLPIPYPIKDLN